MKNENLKKMIADVDRTLRDNGHIATAERLEGLSKQLNDPDVSIDALKKITSMCHIKWMGDLYIHNRGYHEWLHTLNGLRAACEAVIKNSNDA